MQFLPILFIDDHYFDVVPPKTARLFTRCGRLQVVGRKFSGHVCTAACTLMLTPNQEKT